jgi:hypothetical protein
MYLPQLFLLSLTILNVSALKGSNRRSHRRLQGGLPVATTPKDPHMPPPPFAKDPGPVSKDKKSKKCKTAKMAPPTSTPLENGGRYLDMEESGAPPQMEPKPPVEEEEYCLHGDVTVEQCLAARSGKLPKDHQKIQGDVSIDISYDALSKAKEVLNKLTEVLRSKTAADFIGCDSERRRRAVDANMTHDDHPMGPPEMEDPEDLQVTGVDFTNPKIMDAECHGMNDAHLVCDTMSSGVQIYFQGRNVSDADEMEMFALLITTIQEQARDGSFSDIATVERVALTSSISNATESGGSNDTAQTVGIPTGLVGGVLLIAVGALLGYCFLCRSRDAAEDDKQTDEDIIVAEAIVVENEEEEDMYHKKMSKTRFL